MSNTTMNRRPNGQGNIRKRTKTINGKEYTFWEGTITTGYNAATGKQTRKTVTGKTQREVAQKITKIANEVQSNTYFEPSKLMLSEWLDIWIKDYCADKKPLTIRNYSSSIEIHIKPAIGAIPLSKLAPAHIQKFINDLSKKECTGKQDTGKSKSLSPKTIKNIFGTLEKALNDAVEQEIIPRNPADRAKLPKVHKAEITPLSDKNISALLRALSGDEYERFLKVILYTGLRESEAVGLTWDCVDFQKGTIKICKQLQYRANTEETYIFAPLKNSKTRVIMPPPVVMQWLKEERAHQYEMRFEAGESWQGWQNKQEFSTSLCFLRPDGNNVRVSTAYKHFKKAAKQIGMPNARVHDLRHTFATVALQNGESLKTVQEALGHATASFTADIYGHVSEEMKQDAAKRMQQHFEAMMKEA